MQDAATTGWRWLRNSGIVCVLVGCLVLFTEDWRIAAAFLIFGGVNMVLFGLTEGDL